MKARLFGASGRWVTGLLAGGFLLGGGFAARADTNSSSSTNQPAAKAPKPYVSPGLTEILRLLGAKVNPEVVKAYIKTSPVIYNLSPDEIIALKNMGVPDDVVTALLQRDAEIRAQIANASEQNYQPPTEMPPPGQGTTYAPPENTDYGYPGYAAGGYPYSYWWWYNSWYPWAYTYYSPFYLDRFGHRHFRDFDRFGRYGYGGRLGFSVQGGRNFALNNRAGIGNHTGHIFFGQPSGVGGRPALSPVHGGFPSGVGGRPAFSGSAPRPSGVGGRPAFGGGSFGGRR